MEEGVGTVVLALLLGVPWLVILADALLLGFNLVLSVAMLLVFSFALLFAIGFRAES